MESSHPFSVPKVERKVIEKNRRNLMKDLYSQLHSLLPNHASNCKEQLPLPDQIDEAVKYIKSLQMKIEKSKEKKEYLLRRKRPHSCMESDDIQSAETTTNSSPLIEIHEMGASMDVILISGLDSIAMFKDIACLLHEEGVEIVNASFSVSGNSMFQIVHEKIEKSTFGFGATTLSRRLKELVCGASSSDMESQLDFLDFEIEPSLWGCELAEGMLLGVV